MKPNKALLNDFFDMTIFHGYHNDSREALESREKWCYRNTVFVALERQALLPPNVLL